MNPDTFAQIVQKSLRVTIGATASLVEMLQDPERREENLTRLRTDFGQLANEWEIKGESTESEARNFVSSLLSQPFNSSSSTGPDYQTTVSTTATPVTSPDVQRDLQELTAQIAAIRSELERLRADNS